LSFEQNVFRMLSGSSLAAERGCEDSSARRGDSRNEGMRTGVFRGGLARLGDRQLHALAVEVCIEERRALACGPPHYGNAPTRLVRRCCRIRNSIADFSTRCEQRDLIAA